jgi:hypothetical protein
MAKRKGKIKTKGVRYISEKLNKYFSKKYPTKKSASEKAKEVLSILKSNNEKVTIKNISNLIRKKREKGKSKDDAPKLYRELQNPSEYFLLSSYPDWIQLTTNEVWFESKISPSGLPMIQGGSVAPYQDYFKDFVDYINGMIALEEGNEDLYRTEYFVVCTKPNKRNPRRRWESKILAIGSDGIPYSFGFDPNNPEKEATRVDTTPNNREGQKWDEEEPEPKKTPKKEPKSKVEAKPKAGKPKKTPKAKTKTPKSKAKAPKKETKVSDEKTKLELKRLQLIEKIYDMFLQGKITKEEMQKMVAKYE